MNFLKNLWNSIWNWGVKWINENPKRTWITGISLVLYVAIAGFGLVIPQVVFDAINTVLQPEEPFVSTTFTSGLAVFLAWIYAWVKWGAVTKTERENLDKIPSLKKDVREVEKAVAEKKFENGKKE